MGYRIRQRKAKFRLAAEKKEQALAAIKALASKPELMSGESILNGQATKRGFAWVSTEWFLQADSFEEAMGAWRWPVEKDKDGNVIKIRFIGQKLGDDHTLFEAIAPFVMDGSFIEMEGEDGKLWHWFFGAGQVKAQRGKAVLK